MADCRSAVLLNLFRCEIRYATKWGRLIHVWGSWILLWQSGLQKHQDANFFQLLYLSRTDRRTLIHCPHCTFDEYDRCLVAFYNHLTQALHKIEIPKVVKATGNNPTCQLPSFGAVAVGMIHSLHAELLKRKNKGNEANPWTLSPHHKVPPWPHDCACAIVSSKYAVSKHALSSKCQAPSATVGTTRSSSIRKRYVMPEPHWRSFA